MSQSYIKAVIIDDSPQAIRLLKLMIEELASEKVTIAGDAQNAEDGLKIILEQKPDLVFLDIEMPGKSGLDLSKRLIEKGVHCGIVFTTAYNQYAIQAFRLSAIDYLLKPIQEKELHEAIHKAEENITTLDTKKRLIALSQNLSSLDKTISVPSHNGYEFVPVKEILYLEADGAYTHIYQVSQKPIIVSKNLKYFEQTLQHSTSFFRIHRTFLINLQHMISYSKSDRGTITMKNGKIIDLARNRRADFLKLLENSKSL